MRALDSCRRGGRAPGQIRRQQARQDRVPGQAMPKPEHVIGRDDRLDQLHMLRPLQFGKHLGLVGRGDGRQQRPVELPAEHRGRYEHVDGHWPESSQPVPHRAGDRVRDPGADLVVDLPA